MHVPSNLLFTKDHEWVSGASGEVKVGVSSYAIEQLGDIVHIELPEEGDTFEKGESFGTIESTKTVSDLYMPVSGEVVSCNRKLEENPEMVQEDPYENGWILTIKVTSEDQSELMKSSDYEDFIKN